MSKIALGLLLLLLLMIASPLLAETLYVSQAGSGDGSGSSTGNRASAAWFNTAGSWGAGAGKISAGDTVCLAGAITTPLAAQGSGSAGNVITILFETGAKLSLPYGDVYGNLTIQGLSYLVIDGGTNGIVENTDNGTLLGHQTAANGILADGSHDIEVKNLTFQNLYVHTRDPATEPAADFMGYGAYACTSCGVNQLIHDNIFKNIYVGVRLQNATADGAQNWRVYNNTIESYCHGVNLGGGVDGAKTISGMSVYNNHFDGKDDNWHTDVVGKPENDICHRDGVHFFAGVNDLASGLSFYNNLFDGDWGNQGTAYLYLEGNQGSASSSNWGIDDVTIYNNVFMIKTGNYIPNGAYYTKASNVKLFNNTFIGGGSTVSGTLAYQMNATGFRNINNVFSSSKTFLYFPATTTADADFNYNLYADGGTLAFNWGGTTIAFASFSTWQSDITADGNSTAVSSSGLSLLGVPLAGSAVIGAGANLTSLSITALNSDKNGAARPAIGAWDIGAYQYGSSSPSSPTSAGGVCKGCVR